ncbi:Pkinase-domain-containing protein [Hypoxylon fragiforme]|uniref:Pkinase-domain-containing protein n=1 Tax=Hypoxylon fragiforme TaxID=63214 RepID=UPI0020C6BBB1|nr:Pkinase-domain-containing protein [Hypoxylon fragiforme]KAI2612463.1 Pkinase-domain-containing protein [Hypoxylon fragiforme]
MPPASTTTSPPTAASAVASGNIETESNAQDPDSTQSLPLSPQIEIQQYVDALGRPSLVSHLSAPPTAPRFQSPMRQHKRTPSQHREIKETLNAKTEYTNDETDGRSQQTINQYTIKEEIGRGSYGAVHLATDQFGKEYALKEFSKLRLRKRVQSNILRRPEGGRPRSLGPGQGLFNVHRKQLSHHDAAEAKDALYLIREEIAIMKKLDHPNLVQLIEVLDDPDNDSLYMVLEMCKKGVVMKVGLDDQADPYDDEQCRYWFRDLILGIEYLHSQGVVHRDIKPDNLLLTEDDVLKIVDFGVSEMFEKPDRMMTSKAAGSPAFLPPELCQARHGDVPGKPADVWSMGVSLYCLKYGRLPFKRDNVLEMYEAIRTEELQIPVDNEDPAFVDLITRILDKNNETRISLREIRNHPWVTKGGSDPLLSEEENCSDVVEAPNALELNHAFTQKMDHLLCVLMAINRFKGLISKSRVVTPEVRTPRTSLAPGFAEHMAIPEDLVIEKSSNPEPQTPTQPSRQKSIAEEAAELIRQRRAFLASQQHASTHPPASGGVGEKGHAHDLTDKTPLLLGIGTGGHDDFAGSDPPADVVSDSPTGIEFDIYDRAFETEIKRIRSDKKKGRARTYLTRLVGEQEVNKYAGDDCMVLDAGKSPTSNVSFRNSSAIGRGLNQLYEVKERWQHDSNGVEGKRGASEGVKEAVETVKEKGNRFADLVTAMRKDLKGQNSN